MLNREILIVSGAMLSPHTFRMKDIYSTLA